MMQIVHCDHCGGSSIGLDTVFVDVNLKKSRWCEKCRKTDTETTLYFFCSLSCFIEYMKKVDAGDAKIEFDRYRDTTSFQCQNNLSAN